MQRSTATVRSQDKSFLNASNLKQLQKQRTATSNRTGGASSSAHTSTGQKPAEKLKPRVNFFSFFLSKIIFSKGLSKYIAFILRKLLLYL